MGKTITTPGQEKFLKFFATTPELSRRFYFTGGTALSKFYLRHRFSEDLDFFSAKEVEAKDVSLVLSAAKNKLKFRNLDYQQVFNRHLFYLVFSAKKILKTEFTYFPFAQLEKPLEKQGLCVDSLKDIAVNKVFTIHQKPRGRDFFDLCEILKKTNWTLSELLKEARLKFDWRVDLLQFGANLLQVSDLLDDPILRQAEFNHRAVEKFFHDAAKEIGKSIFKQ